MGKDGVRYEERAFSRWEQLTYAEREASESDKGVHSIL